MGVNLLLIAYARYCNQLGLSVRTVRTTHIRWRQDAFASLPDKPLTAPALLARHLDAGGPSVYVNTLARKLKASGVV